MSKLAWVEQSETRGPSISPKMGISLPQRLACASALCVLVVSNGWAGSCDKLLNVDALQECLANELLVADKELNRMYVRLRDNIGDAERDLLKQAESNWINSRDTDCEFEAESVTGGNAYQPVYMSCMISRTKARTKQLSAWAKVFKKR